METDALRRRARFAYERGRLYVAAMRASGVVLAVALLAAWRTTPASFVWLPVTFALWCLAAQRGGDVLRGARRGLLVGLASFALPWSLLRPCCPPGGGDGCENPWQCLGAGAVLGALLLLMPLPRRAARFEALLGVALGAIAGAIVQCGALFVGEALGLLTGILLAATASVLARGLFDRSHA
jgi:hypothetical protein